MVAGCRPRCSMMRRGSTREAWSSFLLCAPHCSYPKMLDILIGCGVESASPMLLRPMTFWMPLSRGQKVQLQQCQPRSLLLAWHVDKGRSCEQAMSNSAAHPDWEACWLQMPFALAWFSMHLSTAAACSRRIDERTSEGSGRRVLSIRPMQPLGGCFGALRLRFLEAWMIAYAVPGLPHYAPADLLGASDLTERLQAAGSSCSAG